MQNGQKPILKLEAVGFAWDIILSIAVPAFIFALGGRWLDARYEMSPLFTLLGLVLAFVIIGIIIPRKAKIMANRMK
jgi:hypothetical protein